MRLSAIHYSVSEGLDDLIHKLIAGTQNKLDDKHGVQKNAQYKKLIDRAETISAFLFTPTDNKAIEWWEQLLNAFGIPEDQHADVFRKLFDAVYPRAKEQPPQQQKQQRRPRKGQKEDENGNTDAMDLLGLGSSKPEKVTEGLLDKAKGALSKLLDDPHKKQALSAKVKRATNNRRVAVLSINFLMDYKKQNPQQGAKAQAQVQGTQQPHPMDWINNPQ